MAIPAHPIPTPPFAVENRFPNLPQIATFAKIAKEDQAALTKWWNDAQIVLQRQFTQVTTEISVNTSDITALEAVELSPSAAPTGVTVGTTVPDKWFAITSGGQTYLIPGWLNH